MSTVPARYWRQSLGDSGERITGPQRSSGHSGRLPNRIPAGRTGDLVHSVTVVIPVYNHWDDLTKPLLDNLSETLRGLDYEIIVSNDGSTDATKDQHDQDRVHFVHHPENTGFAATCNRGAKVALGKVLIFLNNDTTPLDGWVEPLLDSLDRNIGLVGPRIINEQVSTVHDKLPLVGACFALTRALFEELGGFDETFRHGGEDFDLIFRVHQSGRSLARNQQSVVKHQIGGSNDQIDPDELEGWIQAGIATLNKRYPDLFPLWPSNEPGPVEATSIPVYKIPGITFSIVIPAYNHWADLTQPLLDHLFTDPDIQEQAEVIVVDDGSDDQTRNVEKYGLARVLHQPENMGIARALNAGFAEAKGNYLLVLANDTQPEVGWLSKMLAVMEEHPEIGVLAPIYDQEDSSLTAEHLGIIGACMMIRRKCYLEVDGFDNDLVRCGGEDIDFLLRVEQTKWKLGTAPEATVWHQGSATLGQFDLERKKAWDEAGDAHLKRKWGKMTNIPKPLVSIIIPAYNHWEDCTEPLLNILREQSPQAVEVIVVDDGSTDQTATMHGEKLGKVVHRKARGGFAAACNSGAAVAQGDYLVFLNNDTEPQDGWLGPLIKELEGQKVGIAAPVILTETRAVGSLGLVQGTDGTWAHGKAHVDGQDTSVPAVTGACLAIRKDVFWEVGGWDEGFIGGGGCDDVDLCLRVRRVGLRVHVVPSASVLHREGSTRFLLPETQAEIKQNQARLQERWSDAGTTVPTTEWAWHGPSNPAQGGSLAVINQEVTKRLGITLTAAPSDEPVDVLVQHYWPGEDAPERPSNVKHWLVIQPWEMGKPPASFLERYLDADRLIVPSEYCRAIWVDAGFPSEKVAVIPNGVDTKRFCPGPDAILKEFQVLSLGGTIWRKGWSNPDILLEAWQQAFTKGDRASLLVKDQGTESFYQGQSARERIIGLVDYSDADLSTEELVLHYQSADLLVAPSRAEAFCMPVLEAMACGVPVIVPAGGPTDEFVGMDYPLRVPVEWKEDIRGKWYECDPTALAQQMRWVYEHREEARALGKQLREQALPYSWDRIAAQYKTLIEETTRG